MTPAPVFADVRGGGVTAGNGPENIPRFRSSGLLTPKKSCDSFVTMRLVRFQPHTPGSRMTGR
jgi:hypothetical protein